MRMTSFPKLHLLALAFFLAAQLSVALHTADFGTEKHTHHGLSCDIQAFSDHAKAGSLPAVAIPVVETVFVDSVSIKSSALLTVAGYLYAAPRGPPMDLFS